jgi:diguanylate cyclase (GGDEF)-like protein
MLPNNFLRHKRYLSFSNWLPLYVFIGFAAVAVLIWQALNLYEVNSIQRLSISAANNVKNKIELNMDWRVQEIGGMSQRWITRKSMPYSEWYADAMHIIAAQPGYRAISWVDPTYHVRWIAPMSKTNQVAMGFDLLHHGERRRQALLMAQKTNRTQLTRSIDMIIGGKGFLIVSPIFIEEKLSGFITGAITSQKFFDAILKEDIAKESIAPGYEIVIYDGEEPIYQRRYANEEYAAKWDAEAQAESYGVTWRVRVWPSPTLLAKSQSFIPQVALILGLLMAALMALTTRFAQVARSNHQAAQLEIEKRKEIEQELAKQASFDSLTSLPNRALLMDRMTHAIAQAKRSNEQVAILFFDLDHFKTINDSLGHNIGDLLLQATAKRLVKCIRESDTAARLGGDEFVVMLTCLKSAEDAMPVVHKCLNVLAEPFKLAGHNVNISTSIGISIFPKDGQDANQLLKRADTAMYRAKADGRNHFQFFTEELNQQVSNRIKLEGYLRKALARKELFLHYQPLLDLQTGKMLGVEALLRWQHPKLGTISPVEFIPIAEETGLITTMGEWVLQTACQQLKVWQEQGFANLKVSVNVSACQFKHKDMVTQVQQVLTATKLVPECLELELTESTLLADINSSMIMLNQLKALGVSLAIDDFGTGYSSLNYLRRLPVKKLKIDRSFINEVSADPKAEAIILAIIAMANSLGLRVLAEGVETADQVQFLRKHGCHEMQGFYFSRAVTAEEITRLLQEDKHLE